MRLQKRYEDEIKNKRDRRIFEVYDNVAKLTLTYIINSYLNIKC